MFKFFQEISLEHYKHLVIIIILSFLAATLLIQATNVSLVEETLVSSTQESLMVKAKATAHSTKYVFLAAKLVLTSLADHPEIVNQNPAAVRAKLSQIVADSNDLPIKRLALISKTGVMVAVANPEEDTTGEGSSFADRDYFQWAKTAKKGDFYLSRPNVSRAGSSAGKWIIVLATPLVSSKGFDGTLIMAIAVDDLTGNYINAIRTYPGVVTFAINQDGLAVYSPFADMIGLDVRKYAREKKWTGYKSYISMVDKMVSGADGRGEYYFMGSDGKPRHWVNAYVPVVINNRNYFTVAVAAPYERPLDLNKESRTNQSLSGFLLTSAFLIMFVLWIAGLYIARREGYNLGLKECYRKIKSKDGLFGERKI